MKLFKMTAPGSITVEENEPAALSGPDVLVKVTNIGLCGSDLHLFNGNYNGPNRYPLLFGHEWSGVVAAIGESVSGFALGDKVTGDCSKYCGTCGLCHVDRNMCQQIEKFGITVDGASAEYVVRDQRYLYKADPGTDLDLLSLAEPIAVAKHLVDRIAALAPDLKDRKILICGGGPIGQSALLILTDLYGCTDIEMLEQVEYRLAIGIEHGARKSTIAETDLVEKKDYALLYNSARYDVVIETTGSPEVFASAFTILKPLGVLGCLGMITKVEIPQSQIVTKSLHVVGSIGGTGEFESVIRYIETHQDKVARLISHHYPIHDVDQAFQTALTERNTMKINLLV